MKVLYQANLQVNAEKCVLAQESIDWLDHKLTRTGISPVNAKAHGISDSLRPKYLKQLHSFMAALINFMSLIELIPSFAF